ncbi:MAG: hypothetical protein ACOC0H_03190 [Thermodesulfobacteriota bacterium]
MEPVSLITGALAAGATAAVKDTTSQMVKDAYAGLKALIAKKFSAKDKPEGQAALKKYEEKPAVWEAPLQETLMEIGGGQDKEIMEAVKALKQAMETSPEGRQILSKYNLDIKDSQIGVIGDNARVEGGMHFGDKFSVKANKIEGLNQAEKIDSIPANRHPQMDCQIPGLFLVFWFI